MQILYIYIYINICMHVHISTFVFTYACIYIRVNIYNINTVYYLYIYIYTYFFIFIHKLKARIGRRSVCNAIQRAILDDLARLSSRVCQHIFPIYPDYTQGLGSIYPRGWEASTLSRQLTTMKWWWSVVCFWLILYVWQMCISDLYIYIFIHLNTVYTFLAFVMSNIISWQSHCTLWGCAISYSVIYIYIFVGF